MRTPARKQQHRNERDHGQRLVHGRSAMSKEQHTPRRISARVKREGGAEATARGSVVNSLCEPGHELHGGHRDKAGANVVRAAGRSRQL